MNCKMDEKANQIFEHYKYIIEHRKFNEYEILGFLIFIRNFISRNKYNYIYEFADLVAHRKRDRGIVMDCISNAIENKYTHIKGTNKIEGYNGINEKEWQQQWIEFGNEFNIKIDEYIIKELMLCIFSLAQKALYMKNNKKACIDISTLRIDESISLITSEIEGKSLCICFSLYKGYKVYKNYNGIFDKKIVYTKRENEILKLYRDNECILEV